ncbi:MAG: peptide-methionine (S)-S-oxide reductase MsrA [Bacteroidota bacterium]|nr:peptide-methionine (S)-S-oxide reductase MsrA [Bacteroidota bacterium]
MLTNANVILVFLLMMFSLACNSSRTNPDQQGKAQAIEESLDYSKLDTATFAGGCFWCVEASFEQIEGVAEAVSGFAGGNTKNPEYKEVAAGKTDHAETVQVYYDPEIIDYSTLLDIFFTAHDPTQLNRQGPDIGKQYRSAIFYHDPKQLKLVRAAIDSINRSGIYDSEIVTELNPFGVFYPASEYHQDYEKKHPNDPYIRNVSRPRIDKVSERFEYLLKESKR